MGEGSRGSARLVALFLLGVVGFSPIVMRVFNQGTHATVLGIPILFFYLFSAWAILIALLALVTSRATDLDVTDGDDVSDPRPR